MPIAVALLGLVTQAFVTGSADQQRLERRVAALSAANSGLERMTRELRQANWVFFRSSQVVEAEAMVRPNAAAQAVKRFVRYDCTTGACWRSEGPPVAFPPPPGAPVAQSTVVIGSPAADTASPAGRLLTHDVFVPKKVDPVTGETAVDYLQPDLLHIALRIQVRGMSKPVELADGISLRNATKFAR